MSVLIKGMEMPKSCGYCPLRHKARDGDECYLGASLTEYQKRPEDCPLVPVPEHGRLKDYDRIMKEYDGWFSKTESRKYVNMFYALRECWLDWLKSPAEEGEG